MTAVYATREPLQTLTMATTQRSYGGIGSSMNGRRHSARLMEKEDMAPPPLPATNGYHIDSNGANSKATLNGGVKGRQVDTKGTVAKKRKAEYDEEADGFQFTRTKSRRTRKSTTTETPPPAPASPKKVTKTTTTTTTTITETSGSEPVTMKKGRRKHMSFSTPNSKDEKPRRRSKRISNESVKDDLETRTKVEAAATANERPLNILKRPMILPQQLVDQTDASLAKPVHHAEEGSSTTISLPFADTPVIRRNKEMRQGKAGKNGARRSSLGMRGRRASSLIESGNSNALPHSEVESQEFYKHIESEGLSEPRRMRQLLTWCATRAMGEKPTGSNTGKESEILAARVIQEELLKDFSNKSEMSDWFSREDVPPPAISIIKRPNPKNVQNAARIKELEQQIAQLQTSLSTLTTLTNHAPIPSFPLPPASAVKPSSIDSSLLDPTQQSLLQLLLSPPESTLPDAISERINNITEVLEPTIDRFADGMHRLNIFRDMADRVAGRVLGSVAEGLERRDKPEMGEKEDLRGLLRALSRVDR